MMTKEIEKNREQIQFFSMDDMVPENHLLRLIEQSIDFSFIYDLVEDKYCLDNGRPSIDPVILIKIQLIQCLYGIRSMRQTIKDIEVNVAYRWFLGLSMLDPVPHFTTFGKNYSRRFKGTDLYEKIFERVLEECFSCGYVDETTVFIDATHIKAAANNKKYIKQEAKRAAKYYEAALVNEISKDRDEHGKKPLKDKDDDNDDSDNASGGSSGSEVKTVKVSTTDPESGWFHKGEHKEVFAYCAETAVDKNGWILGYTVHPGNEHDSTTFPAIYEKIKNDKLKMVVADAGYKTPAIAKQLIDDGVEPLFPYKAPMTKDGFFRKYEYVYDEAYDCYLCPNDKMLFYSTTNRDGYKEYKSNPDECKNCPYLEKCTKSKNHQKVINRHVWEEYMEVCEDIRHTLGNKEIYDLRKETVERVFGTAKEQHGLRYTNMIGKARMEMKVGLTFACMNLKKLAKMKQRHGLLRPLNDRFSFIIFRFLEILTAKRKPGLEMAF